ncbi:hypothetical protein AHOG_01700 [Actinoalloteichus hoggarensis]|uniref:Nudix hydrolase domain-containing protein n=2 Tax=Actinoalloteichus hoggarensis TaxID=1470176 RepID=A0A221VWW6_9PSEU|nr:hypothetical protein AHOG_01700 [Actinoalloteichus hoggarensis]
MAELPRHSVSVAGVVVRDDGRILVIRRADDGRWEPPGGVLELDETFEEGVRREVREETGVAVTVTRLTGVYKNLRRGVVALVFHCTPRTAREVGSSGGASPVDPPVGPRDGEAREVRWMSRDEVERMMLPAYAVRVGDAMARSGVAVRVHDGAVLLDTSAP